jgi:hypothetical protein
MTKFKICSVQLLEGRDLKLKYFYPEPCNFTKEDKTAINGVGEKICKLLSNYTDTTSEEFVFQSYFEKGKISMDIDSMINKRLNQSEKQRLADKSAYILNIVAKYLE